LKIAAHAIGSEGEWGDPSGRFRDFYGVGESGAVLVRPDGHVAFRAAESADAKDATERLAESLRRILHFNRLSEAGSLASSP
jgi:hypothetical protein